MRLGLLMASVAAFLLVPVAVASAAEAEIVFAGSGSGTLTGGAPVPGEPPLDCFGKAGVAEGPVCTSETQPLEGFDAIKVEREAAPGSKFAGFKVIAGQNLGTCPVESFETTECVVLSFGEKIIIEATFELEPNVHVILDGDGSGTVVGYPAFVGNPPVNCHWDGVTEEQTGDCDVLPTTAGGFTGINLEQEAEPGSEFGGWTVESGFVPEEGCEPLAATCGALFLGPVTEIKIRAKFFKIVPKFNLNLSTSGTGSGSLECDTGSGAEACQAEYKEGTEVTVIGTAGIGSEAAVYSGDCTGSSCELTMNAEKSVDAQFDLEQVPFTTEVKGEGTVLCNGGACAVSYPYGTEVEVTATPDPENVLSSLTGSGSLAGTCNKETGSCAKTAIIAPSGVSAVFAGAKTVAQQVENVHGEVPETTELATSCGNDVDLGIFTPGLENRYWYVCNLTITSTGEESELRAKDETGVGAEGHLTQIAGKTYNLPEPLEMTAESTIPLNGVPNGGLEPLDAGGVTLMSYPTPVSADSVDAEFSQWIRTHDPLHTGVYSKEITLTLEQTEP